MRTISLEAVPLPCIFHDQVLASVTLVDERRILQIACEQHIDITTRRVKQTEGAAGNPPADRQAVSPAQFFKLILVQLSEVVCGWFVAMHLYASHTDERIHWEFSRSRIHTARINHLFRVHAMST